MPLSQEELARFGVISPRDATFCDLSTPCEDFEGPKVRGYGRVTISSKLYIAHRFSYAFYRKVDIECIKGLVIRHLCHNPSCFNPRHLASGDSEANDEDARLHGLRSQVATRVGNARKEAAIQRAKANFRLWMARR
jgi:hypothetical protein